MIFRASTLFNTTLLVGGMIATLFNVELSKACSIMESSRKGTFLVESSIRTTSDPNLLVAQLGEYDQKEEDHWGTRHPVSVQDVTINAATGDISLGYPPSNVTINEPLNGTVLSQQAYSITTDVPGGLATLTGPTLGEPFVFDYNPKTDSRFDDAFLFSEQLQHAYIFYNAPTGTERDYYGQPTVAIVDLSNPAAPTVTEFEKEGRPEYFNGPPTNVFDSIQVVELPDSGADCFSGAYYYYNETGVRLVGYRKWTRDSFQLTAISQDGQYAYNVRNWVLPNNNDNDDNNNEAPLPVPKMMLPPGGGGVQAALVNPSSYVLEKLDIATGHVTDILLRNTANEFATSTTGSPKPNNNSSDPFTPQQQQKDETETPPLTATTSTSSNPLTATTSTSSNIFDSSVFDTFSSSAADTTWRVSGVLTMMALVIVMIVPFYLW